MKSDAPYCIDSSALIAAWDERYPPDHFPKFWSFLDGALVAGNAFIHQSVIDELTKKSKDLATWLKERNSAIIEYEEEIQLKSKYILQKYPRLVMERKLAFAADPFVISISIIKGYIVVSEEGFGSKGKPKIPDVCLSEGQKCIKLLEMIRTESWIIG